MARYQWVMILRRQLDITWIMGEQLCANKASHLWLDAYPVLQ
jgi:hypothetical protein